MNDLIGKTFVVTGASAGIGRATALALAERGATLALVARESGRLRDIAALIQTLPLADAHAFPGDLATVGECRRVAEEIRASLGTVDVLINNVGRVFPERRDSADGYEKTFALNHLGHFALTDALLPALKTAAHPRVIEVASQAHAHSLAVEDLHAPGSYNGLAAYRDSKLANILFAAELHRRHGDWLVTASLHPGVVDTELLNDYDRAVALDAGGAQRGPSVLGRAMSWARSAAGRSHRSYGIAPNQGAAMSVFAATSDALLDQRGLYWRDGAASQPAAISADPDAAAALWEHSVTLITRAGLR